MNADRVRRALQNSGALGGSEKEFGKNSEKKFVPNSEEDSFLRKIKSRKRANNRKNTFQLPPRRVSGDTREPKPKTLMKVVKPPSTNHVSRAPAKRKRTRDPYYDMHVKFFSNFISGHETRKKFGVQRIVQELQRSEDDVNVYGNFFEKSDHWTISPLPEMNLLRPGDTIFHFEPQCILGIGGQGCVFMGKIGSASYAFKIRSRTSSAIHSGTATSPGRRRSPSFRSGDRGRIHETTTEEGIEERGRKKHVNFIDDTQQESLHREAVAAFRVYSSCNMLPKPLLYGYTGKQQFEVFVMETMDYTLNDLVRGTLWKTRMGVINNVWSGLKDCIGACKAAGVVHFDLKPENVAFKLEPSTVSMGLIDFGITKSNDFSLEKYTRGAKLFRPPGTPTFMSPRTHLWKPMGYIDDFLSSFFTMYIYGTTEGGNNYTKLVKGGNARRFRYPVSLEDRKTMTPEEVSIYCLKYPPWARFPYGSVHPLKKKQNETIVKEEVSLGMLKIHSMTSPESMGDIISILLNLDGFLDDTMDVQGTESREDFSAAAVAFLETFLGKHVPKFVSWWLEFAKTSRAMIDDLHSKTPEKTKRKNMASVTEILRKNIPKPEEILGLINDSSYGTKIVEGN